MSSESSVKIVSDLNLRHLSENLRQLMAQRNLDTTHLCKLTGIAATTINSLRKGIGNPTLSTLQILAELFGISIGELTESDINLKLSNNSSAYEIPLLELNNLPEFLHGSYRPNKTLTVELDQHDRKNCFAIKLSNNSLAPIFEKGTIFIVCPELLIRDGDTALVQFNQHLPCFRKVFIEDETFFFSPLSEIIGKDVIKSKNFIILGIVIKAIQNFLD